MLKIFIRKELDYFLEENKMEKFKKSGTFTVQSETQKENEEENKK